MFILLFWIIRRIVILIRKNLIIILIRIEIIRLSLAYKIIIIKNNYLKFFRFFKYYFIQSFIIYLILINLFLFEFNFYRINFLLIFILCKINLFPRHIWINEIFYTLDVKEFFLLRVLAKIPVIFFILSFYTLNYIIIISVLLTFFWTILSLKNFNHNNMLFSFSNLNSSCWIVILCIGPPFLFFIFIFLYINIILSVIYNKFLLNSKKNTLPIRLLNIARFPLRTIFFLKIILLNFLTIRNIFILFLLLCNSYITFMYFKYMLNLISNTKKYITYKIYSFFFLYIIFSFCYFFFF